jgi:hypothetical protein
MAGEIVTSCPLCLALSDPTDMIDVEIDRVVPKGRAHVLLCRICGSAIVRAMAQAGEPLAKDLIELDHAEAERPPARDEKRNPAGDPGPQEAKLHLENVVSKETPEEPTDG